MQEKKKSVLKVALAAGAVIVGSFLGATIGAPMLSLAQSEGEVGTPNPVDGAVDSVTDTVDDATAPLTDQVQQAPLPAPGTTGGQVAPAQQPGDDERPAPGPHTVGDCTEAPLSAEDDAKVRAAVEEEVPGATIDRIGTDCDGEGAYEAHLKRSDGTCATAFLSEEFEVTSVQEGGPGGRGSPGHRGPRPGAPAPQGEGTTAENASA